MLMIGPAALEAVAEQTNADAWALWNYLWNLCRSGDLFSICGGVFFDRLAPLTPSVSFALIGVVIALPVILYQIWAFVAPGLYSHEKKLVLPLIISSSLLFFAGVVVYSFFIDAPLKELANPMIPENPAKAPWYFLGLQELLSYSAFMGGVGLPALALLGLALIPYLDREQQHVGIWFSNQQGKKAALQSLVVGSLVLIGLLAFVINFGWFRNWWPNVPQLLITLINPGNIWVGFMIGWSVFVIKKTGSTRTGAIALFTLFLVSFLILTYVGTELRGPNWGFYWSQSQWPAH